MTRERFWKGSFAAFFVKFWPNPFPFLMGPGLVLPEVKTASFDSSFGGKGVFHMGPNRF